MRKKLSSYTPYAGNGKLTEYNTRKDSWILDQLDRDEYVPGIQVVGTNDFLRFAGKAIKIASGIVASLDPGLVQKTYDACEHDSCGHVLLRWSTDDGTDAMQLGSLKYYHLLLRDLCNADLQSLHANTPFVIDGVHEVASGERDKMSISLDASIVLGQGQNMDVFIKYLNDVGFQNIKDI